MPSAANTAVDAPIERCVGLAVAALAAASVAIAHARGRAETANLRHEQVLATHRAQAEIQELIARQRTFLLQKAEAFSQYQKLVALEGFLASRSQAQSSTPNATSITQVLAELVRELESQFDVERLEAEAIGLGLFLPGRRRGD